MYYAHGESRASELLSQAVGLMDERRIPPNPANYSIWYEFASDENPALRREIESLIEAEADFDPNTNIRLFESFFGFGQEGQKVVEFGANLTRRMEAVGNDLEHAGKETGSHCQRLSALVGEEGELQSSDQVVSIVREVLAETREIISANRLLEGRLAKAATEIDGLKESLAEVRLEAMRDSLTGVVNRKYLDVRLSEQLTFAAANDDRLCVILLDIDRFKQFNDQYGHQVGDQVLKVVARAIDDCIRGSDTLGRYGGEEFCVILPSTGLEGGAAVAENIRKSMESKVLRGGRDGRDFGRVTASLGVTESCGGEPADAVVARADAALYQAKRNGRNQVCVAEADIALV